MESKTKEKETPRRKDLQNLVEDLKDYKATRESKDNDFSDSLKSKESEGKETWQQFEGEINFFDILEEEQKENGEDDHDVIESPSPEIEVLGDPRGPGFEPAFKPEKKKKLNLFWKIFTAILITAIISTGITFFLTSAVQGKTESKGEKNILLGRKKKVRQENQIQLDAEREDQSESISKNSLTEMIPKDASNENTEITKIGRKSFWKRIWWSISGLKRKKFIALLAMVIIPLILFLQNYFPGQNLPNPNEDIFIQGPLEFYDMFPDLRIEGPQWFVGGEFKLTEDDNLLVSLCKEYNVQYTGGFAMGWKGTIKQIFGAVARVHYNHKNKDAIDTVPLRALLPL